MKYVLTFLVGVFLLLFFSPSTVKAAIIGAPFVTSSKEVIRKALKLAGLKKGETFYDLGSGDGRSLIIANKEFKAKAVGFEYSRPLSVFSRINLFLNRAKGNIYRKNFFTGEVDLSKADVIFMFLTPKAFPKLKEKFEKELKPGTRIVTYSSELVFWKPDKVIENEKAVGKTFLYIR